MLEAFGTGQGYLKAGFLGFPKGGKTFTATKLALYLHERFGMTTPIAAFDTETGLEYVVPMIVKATGKAPIGKKSRSLADLLTVTRECQAGAAEILIVDSITHVWRECCAAYLDQVNRARAGRNMAPRTRLEFQDWAAIKERWNVWTDLYLNSSLHIIICGRAGFEWDFETTTDDAGVKHKELVKTGIKMKVEGEFGFEPSLLVEMERVQVPADDNPDRFQFTHRARILGDRFGVMDGQTQDNPKGEWFEPYIAQLLPGASNVVDTALKTDMGVDEEGRSRMEQERRERAKLLEEIQGEIVTAWPGQKAEEKRAKIKCLDAAFGTKSWTAVEGMSVIRLLAGLNKLREWIVEKRTETGGEE